MEHTCVIIMWLNDPTTLQPKKYFERLQQPFSSDVTLRVENLKLSPVFLVPSDVGGKCVNFCQCSFLLRQHRRLQKVFLKVMLHRA